MKIKDNKFSKSLEIEGIKYAYQFFKDFAKDIPLGVPMKIVSRRDGVLEVVRIMGEVK